MTILVLAAIAALQPAPAAPPAGAEQRIFEASGYVFDFEAENDDWFQFGGSSQRFRLPSNERELQTYLRLLSAAQERRVALTVRYDASAGRADTEGAYVEYPLCALAAPTGASFGDETANCPPRPAPSGEAGERALALGLALATGQPAAARRRLGEAIADPRLAPSLRVLALQARGEAAETMAYALPPAGEAFDRAAFEALADYRAWVTAEPAEPRAHYATARILASLGGYQEAMAIYRAMGRRWPDEAFQLAIHTGALFRQQGRYREALAAFDAYARPSGAERRHAPALSSRLGASSARPARRGGGRAQPRPGKSAGLCPRFSHALLRSCQAWPSARGTGGPGAGARAAQRRERLSCCRRRGGSGAEPGPRRDASASGRVGSPTADRRALRRLLGRRHKTQAAQRAAGPGAALKAPVRPLRLPARRPSSDRR